MLKANVIKAIENTAILERKKLEDKCSEDETVVLLPTRVKFTDKGLIGRISVLNTNPYLALNDVLRRECCPICGEFVEEEMFVSSREGQKTHIECFIKSQKKGKQDTKEEPITHQSNNYYNVQDGNYYRYEVDSQDSNQDSNQDNNGYSYQDNNQNSNQESKQHNNNQENKHHSNSQDYQYKNKHKGNNSIFKQR